MLRRHFCHQRRALKAQTIIKIICLRDVMPGLRNLSGAVARLWQMTEQSISISGPQLESRHQKCWQDRYLLFLNREDKTKEKRPGLAIFYPSVDPKHKIVHSACINLPNLEWSFSLPMSEHYGSIQPLVDKLYPNTWTHTVPRWDKMVSDGHRLDIFAVGE